VVDSRELTLSSIEEVPPAAHKIAAAIVRGAVIEADHPAPDDMPPPPSPAPAATPGRVSTSPQIHFAVGLLGQFPPLDRSATPAPGASLEVHGEFPRVQVVGNFRFGADSSDRSVGLIFVEFSMGARYYLSDADFSPYLGGGFAWSYLSLTDNVHNDFDGNRTGLGAYAEAGVEFLRTHHSHVAAGIRVDAPFYSLPNNRGGVIEESPPSGVPSTTPATAITTFYYLPLQLEVRATF
jgi:hypothetical protein